MKLNMPLPDSKKPRTIDPGELKRLASELGNRKDVAKALKMHYSYLCSKLGNSLTLTNALNEGLAEYKEKQK